MKVKAILETALYVDDLEKSEEFYIRILGLRLNSKEKGRSCFLECSNRMLLLFNPEQTKVDTGIVPTHGAIGQGHVAFEIDDNQFDTWRDYLKKNSVVIEREVKWPEGGQSIYFRDPSGNSLELTIPIIWGLK